MKVEELLSQLKAKKFQPIYFLEGEEPYYIDLISDYIEKNVLNDAEKGFNQTVLYGKDVKWQELMAVVKRFPMMSPLQVVILKEAQQMKDLEKLESYFEKPLPSTLFVVCYKGKKLDKRTKFSKTVSKSGNIFTSERVPEWEIENWIKSYVAENGYKVNTSTSSMLKEYLGNDLQVIVNELQKLMLNLPAGSSINEVDVEKYIGISREFNVFELQKALSARDSIKANKFLNYCQQNPKANSMPLVVGSLYGYYSKLFTLNVTQSLNDKDIANVLGLDTRRHFKIIEEYRMALKFYNQRRTEKCLAVLLEYDLRSKGINSSTVPDEDLMVEMVYKLLN